MHIRGRRESRTVLANQGPPPPPISEVRVGLRIPRETLVAAISEATADMATYDSLPTPCNTARSWSIETYPDLRQRTQSAVMCLCSATPRPLPRASTRPVPSRGLVWLVSLDPRKPPPPSVRIRRPTGSDPAAACSMDPEASAKGHPLYGPRRPCFPLKSPRPSPQRGGCQVVRVGRA